MRALPLAVLVLTLACGSAIAGKNQNGALVVHTNDAYSYSANGLCERFETLDSPGDCQSAGTRTDLDPSTPALIWFIAAFLPTDNPGVTVIYFGTEHNLAPGSIPQWGFCGPAGSLEIPDAGWPEAGGNSLAFGSPILGDTFFPFYTFNCYGGAGSTFGSGINPTGGYAAFVDDADPPRLDEIARFGRVAWQGSGTNECPEGPAQLGACCLPDGSCFISFPTECLPPNQYWGDGMVCDPNPCPPGFEACCFGDGHCQDLPADLCVDGGGTPGGVGSTCAETECPAGACCFPSGYCRIRSEEACAQEGGVFQGQDTDCDPNPCGGACCFEDGHCIFESEGLCVEQGGVFQGVGTGCMPNLCPQPPTGACCIDNQCSVTTEADCDGDYLGHGTVCDPNPCPQLPTGACCFPQGWCEIHTEEYCGVVGGAYQGDDTECAPNLCPVVPTGACCMPGGLCEIRSEASCHAVGGSYVGDGIDCDPNPCAGVPTERRSWGDIKALFGKPR